MLISDLLIQSFTLVFFQLSLGFGLDFEFGLELMLGLEFRLGLGLGFWIRARIATFLFLRYPVSNVTAASVKKKQKKTVIQP